MQKCQFRVCATLLPTAVLTQIFVGMSLGSKHSLLHIQSARAYIQTSQHAVAGISTMVLTAPFSVFLSNVRAVSVGLQVATAVTV